MSKKRKNIPLKIIFLILFLGVGLVSAYPYMTFREGSFSGVSLKALYSLFVRFAGFFSAPSMQKYTLLPLTGFFFLQALQVFCGISIIYVFFEFTAFCGFYIIAAFIQGPDPYFETVRYLPINNWHYIGFALVFVSLVCSLFLVVKEMGAARKSKIREIQSRRAKIADDGADNSAYQEQSGDEGIEENTVHYKKDGSDLTHDMALALLKQVKVPEFKMFTNAEGDELPEFFSDTIDFSASHVKPKVSADDLNVNVGMSSINGGIFRIANSEGELRRNAIRNKNGFVKDNGSDVAEYDFTTLKERLKEDARVMEEFSAVRADLNYDLRDIPDLSPQRSSDTERETSKQRSAEAENDVSAAEMAAFEKRSAFGERPAENENATSFEYGSMTFKERASEAGEAFFRDYTSRNQKSFRGAEAEQAGGVKSSEFAETSSPLSAASGVSSDFINGMNTNSGFYENTEEMMRAENFSDAEFAIAGGVKPDLAVSSGAKPDSTAGSAIAGGVKPDSTVESAVLSGAKPDSTAGSAIAGGVKPDSTTESAPSSGASPSRSPDVKPETVFKAEVESGQASASGVLEAKGDSEAESGENLDPTFDAVSSIGGLRSSRDGSYVYDASKYAYQFPPESYLKHYESSIGGEIDLERDVNGRTIIDTLQQFKIQLELVGIQRGPAFTLYEFALARGIKVNNVQNYSDNIAMDLAVQSVRILAPIPGKSAIGIEVPNKERDTVGFDVMLPAIRNPKLKIPMALGVTITGEKIAIDVASTPHLIIAGTTGSGKSVCVNGLICSLLYTRTPRQVRLLLVDPKMVEMSMYNDIPHLLTPVITDSKRTIKAMAFIVGEMERRMKMFSLIGVKKIDDYNEKIKQGEYLREELPYIVVIIDEFGDLMMAAGKELENYIIRIAAVARFTGIHLVLATQRPSSDVITGLIKSNIPTQIAFAVPNRVSSQVILDSSGAENLLGRGDMLYKSASSRAPLRIQGAYIDSEVEKIVSFVKTQGKPDYIDESYFEDDESEETHSESESQGGGSEDLYMKAWRLVAEKGEASASYLQRRLQIGYNRAANLIEQLEENGCVGPARGSKPREVLRYPDSNAEKISD